MATATVKAIDADSVPVGHIGGAPLYGRMMKAISSGHTFGNRVRMLKLPLIFAEERLYAGAITQFFLLSETLEEELTRHAADPMVARVRGLGLCVTPGYAADLEQLYGADWRNVAKSVETKATAAYVEDLKSASIPQLVAAAFILYGALVVGGGKMTQQKVRKVFPSCEHQLFDVAEDMKAARANFKACFTGIGKDFPEHFETLEHEAARYMSLNNTVVLSVSCWGRVATRFAAGVAIGALGVALAVRYSRGLK